MTTFDGRDKAFENKYAHDEETAFRIRARATKLVGLWAAALMGKTAKDAETYAAALVQAEMAIDSAHLLEHLEKDFAAHNVTISTKEIRIAIAHQGSVASEQIHGTK